MKGQFTYAIRGVAEQEGIMVIGSHKQEPPQRLFTKIGIIRRVQPIIRGIGDSSRDNVLTMCQHRLEGTNF